MLTKRILPVVVLIFVTAWGLLGVDRTAAQPGSPGSPEEMPPSVPLFTPDLRIAYQRVDVTIADQIATTRVEQLFVNDNDWLLEGQYFFPLPEDAAVSELVMWVDGQPIEARLLGKDEARQIYDDIVRQLRDPALLEYVGRSAIQANVFPIPPHAERRIEIEYSYLLPADGGLIHYIYPQSSSLYTNAPLEEQRIRVAVESNEAIRAIYSPSHDVDVFRDGEFRAMVGYEDSNVVAGEDFDLYYTVSPEEIGLNLLSYREPGQDGFFMLLVAPNVEAREIIAKDVLLVLDTSGSMEGEKLDQVKEAARYVVEHLNAADRFNLIAFSTGVRAYAPALRAADGGLDGVMQFIDSLDAVGGTNISTALLEAGQMVDADGERPSTIIFLTDGLATEGITDTGRLLQSVADTMPGDARIFAFGVGSDVDPDLLDALAQNHRGITTYVRPGQDIGESVSSFYAKVSTPVLSNISLDFDGITVEQVYPQALPDLFAGSQLVLTGRYRSGGSATITLTGEVNGEPQTFTYAENRFHDSGGDEFIPRLWATRAIGHLLREIRLNGENPELVQSVVSLSTRYGVITPYTSFLIEEDDIWRQMPGALEDGDVAPPMALPASTRGAVDVVEEAAVAAEMAEAEAPLSPAGGEGSFSSSSDGGMQAVGDKTFVLRGGVWIDTTYVPDEQPRQGVAFAGETYFALLADKPELARYFALGERVLVVVDGVAYESTDAETGDEETPASVEPTGPNVEPVPVDARPPTPPREPVAQPNMCGAALALPLFLGFGGIVMWYGRRRSR